MTRVGKRGLSQVRGNEGVISAHATHTLTLVGLLAIAGAMAQTAKTEQNFDPSRDAAANLAAGIMKAKSEKKRVLVDFGGNWCDWCHKLDKLFKEGAEIAKMLQRDYVIVKVNYGPENKNEKVLANFPERKGFPHLFVLDGKGKLLHNQDMGWLETGDHQVAAKVKEY